MAQNTKGKKVTTVRRRRERKNIEQGQCSYPVHHSTTPSLPSPICRATQSHGLPQEAWDSEAPRKSTPFAAQTAAETAARAANGAWS